MTFDQLPAPADLVPLLPGAAVAAVVLLVAGRLLGTGRARAAAVAAGLAVGAVYVITYWRLGALPPLPSGGLQSTERAFWVVVAFVLGAIGAALLRSRPRAAELVHVGLAGGAAFYLLEPFLVRAPDDPTAVSAKAAMLLAGGIVLAWAVLEGITERQRGPAVPLALAAVLGASGQIVFLYGSGFLAQLAGATSIALVAAAALSRWLPDRRLPVAAVGAVVGVMASIGIDSFYFLYEPPPARVMLALAGAPALLAVALAPKIRGWRPVWRLALQMMLVLAVVAWAYETAVEMQPPVYEDPYAGFGK